MTLKYTIIFLLIPVFSIDNAFSKKINVGSKTVQILQGPVLGYKDPKGPFVFYDIPYATAPTGVNKYKAPLPPPSWITTFEAVDRKVTCTQSAFREPKDGTKSEDCLVASVFTPDTNRTNLPVYVIIHGGEFKYGFGNEWTPKEIVNSKEIVAVTLNYRLGVQGFLCLGTEAVPGNAGLKDQVAALRWIKNNIASFGGNPEDITISGSSAGAGSAEMMLLSKCSRNLFQKLVVMSGASMAFWSSDQKPIKRAQEIAQKLNFTNVDDIYTLETFYTTTPLSVLWSIEEMFQPCLENDFGQEIFLEQAPVDILQSGNIPKIPILYGFCDTEGLARTTKENGKTGKEIFEKNCKKMNTEFYKVLPLGLHFNSLAERDDVSKAIKKYYFGDRVVNESTIKGYIDFYGDTWFMHPMLISAKLLLLAGQDQLYLHEFKFPLKNEPFDNITIIGAGHASQNQAVLDQENEDEFNDDYKAMKEVMRDLWYNFILTGQPVPQGSPYPAWPPMDSTNRTPYMVLNSQLSLRRDYRMLAPRIQLWDTLYDKYYKSAVPPKTCRVQSCSRYRLYVIDIMQNKTQNEVECQEELETKNNY